MAEKTIKVKMTIKDMGDVLIDLYPEVAPITVDNFLKLVDAKFYDNKIFHRVIKGFMIQGGCPLGQGTGGPGWTIKGEFSSNGIINTLKHKRGVLSMARSMMPNSAGSQFFIMHMDAVHLDGQYAAFGKVVDGLEFIDKIAETKTLSNDKPVTDQVIESITRV